MKKDSTTELMEMLFKISRLMKQEMSYTNNLTHLSILQIQALIFVNQHTKVSMSELAKNFRIELPSVTSLVNKLCEQKLVERYEDPEDRRLVMIILTTDGKKLLEQAILARRKKIEKLLSYLSVGQKSELLSILKTFNTILQK
jgi:DNA-binding MarR family transcriptional regulator